MDIFESITDFLKVRFIVRGFGIFSEFHLYILHIGFEFFPDEWEVNEHR